MFIWNTWDSTMLRQGHTRDTCTECDRANFRKDYYPKRLRKYRQSRASRLPRCSRSLVLAISHHSNFLQHATLLSLHPGSSLIIITHHGSITGDHVSAGRDVLDPALHLQRDRARGRQCFGRAWNDAFPRCQYP